MIVRAKPNVQKRELDEFDNQNLTPGKSYVVLTIDDEYYRVLNDADEPILYPKYLFVVEDARESTEWIRRDYADGEYHIGPLAFHNPGFFDEFFDGVESTRARFYEICRRLTDEARGR